MFDSYGVGFQNARLHLQIFDSNRVSIRVSIYNLYDYRYFKESEIHSIVLTILCVCFIKLNSMVMNLKNFRAQNIITLRIP